MGDLVWLSILEEDSGIGVIEKIEKRKTVLMRPKVANVTQALIVFSYKEPNLHLDLLDRFITQSEAACIDSVIAFNKIDLVNDKEKEKAKNIREIYEKAGYKVIGLSAYENIGIDELRPVLDGAVTVFAGPSGAGKSSIFNRVCNEELMEIGELSQKIRRGKHTTRHSQLVKLGEGSYVVDSPGFSSLSLDGIAAAGLKGLFRELKEPGTDCRFADCNHIDEPGCMVKQGVLDGLISEERYERYLSFYRELKERS